MADELKPTSTRLPFCCDATCAPSSYGWQPSVLYNQHFGLPPLLDSRDLNWMESLFRKLGSSSWSGYTRASRLMTMVHRELSEGVSEVYTEQCKWTVSLDVNHFKPTEIMVRTQSGYLVIEGKHEERQDEHGYISRCFIRKYKLPLGAEAETFQSCLSGDGILTVEVKLMRLPMPADVTIPVQVEAPTVEDKQEGGLQREGTAEGDGLPQAKRDPSQPPVLSGPEEKPQDDLVAQQTDYEDKLDPTAPKMEEEDEPIPSTAAEGQQEEKTEEQRELMQGEAQQQEDVTEKKVEDAGEASEEGQLEAAQTPDTVIPQLEEKPEAVAEGEEVQEVAGEGEQQEQPAIGQTQENIPSQLEVQAQLVLEKKLLAK